MSCSSSSSSSSSSLCGPVVLLHGGAGLINSDPSIDRSAYKQAMTKSITLGYKLLKQGASALDIVHQVCLSLEEDPVWNAGRGSVYTQTGQHELDASIMDGKTRKCGAVALLKTTRNPISAARLVMERTPHNFLAGSAADGWAACQGLEQVENQWFGTESRRKEWQAANQENPEGVVNDWQGESILSARGNEKLGTVGVVCLDQSGNLAAATSTGGRTNKWNGRIGDTAVIGAGTYAENGVAAVSGTGHGESFISSSCAFDVCALMKYGGHDIQSAADKAISNMARGGPDSIGGLIAVDSSGRLAMPFNSAGMFRAFVRLDGTASIGIFNQMENIKPFC